MTGELDPQGTHAAITKQVVLFVLLAEILAAAGHEGPPHRPFGRPRSHPRPAGRRSFRESLAGRRPRG